MSGSGASVDPFLAGQINGAFWAAQIADEFDAEEEGGVSNAGEEIRHAMAKRWPHLYQRPHPDRPEVRRAIQEKSKRFQRVADQEETRGRPHRG